jgi:hypothetical protein
MQPPFSQRHFRRLRRTAPVLRQGWSGSRLCESRPSIGHGEIRVRKVSVSIEPEMTIIRLLIGPVLGPGETQTQRPNGAQHHVGARTARCGRLEESHRASSDGSATGVSGAAPLTRAACERPCLALSGLVCGCGGLTARRLRGSAGSSDSTSMSAACWTPWLRRPPLRCSTRPLDSTCPKPAWTDPSTRCPLGAQARARATFGQTARLGLVDRGRPKRHPRRLEVCEGNVHTCSLDTKPWIVNFG